MCKFSLILYNLSHFTEFNHFIPTKALVLHNFRYFLDQFNILKYFYSVKYIYASQHVLGVPWFQGVLCCGWVALDFIFIHLSRKKLQVFQWSFLTTSILFQHILWNQGEHHIILLSLSFMGYRKSKVPLRPWLCCDIEAFLLEGFTV